MTTDSTVTAALLGLTHPHARHHLRTLQLCDRVSRIVLWDDDASAIDALPADGRAGVSAAGTDLATLLGAEAPRFAVCNLRNDRNPDGCLACIEAGVHVLSEKPVATSALGVQRVVAAAARAHLVLGVLYVNRFQPAVREARRLVRDGVLGRITACEARLVTSQVRFRDPGHWLFDRASAGGGILSWLGCHHLDLMRYVTGDEITDVSAMTATLGGEAIDVEDVAALALRFRGGALGSLQAGYQLPRSAAGYSAASYDSYFAVRGDMGHLWWNPTARPLRLHVESVVPDWRGGQRRTHVYEPDASEAYGGDAGGAFLEAFIDATLGHAAPPATGADALAIARIVEAAYRASDTGRHVRLETT